MIYGAQYWNDKNKYYIQNNNPTEELLDKVEGESWLQSCGPTAAINCLSSLGYDLKIKCPGIYEPQPEEVLMDFFNDFVNFEELKKIRHDVDPDELPGNRIPQWYPYAVSQVFGASAVFVWMNDMGRIIISLKKKRAVQLCLKKPGHYIAAVAYDDIKNEIIYNDPWPDRFKDGNGFNKRMNKNEFDENVKDFCIIYFHPAYGGPYNE